MISTGHALNMSCATLTVCMLELSEGKGKGTRGISLGKERVYSS